jgi:predicted transposase/invertase (TIGR01784 family)
MRTIRIFCGIFEGVRTIRNGQISLDLCFWQGASPKEYREYFEGKQRSQRRKAGGRCPLSGSVNPLKMTILRIPREEFKQLTYTNTDLLRTSEDDKLGILDVRVETASGHDIDIEIQFADMEGMRERIVYYASKMLSSRMHAGYEYGNIKKTIVIVIAHFDWFKSEKNYFHRFLLRDEDTGYVFSYIMEVNTLELPKIPEVPEQAGDHGLWNWAALLAAK